MSDGGPELRPATDDGCEETWRVLASAWSRCSASSAVSHGLCRTSFDGRYDVWKFAVAKGAPARTGVTSRGRTVEMATSSLCRVRVGSRIAASRTGEMLLLCCELAVGFVKLVRARNSRACFGLSWRFGALELRAADTPVADVADVAVTLRENPSVRRLVVVADPARGVAARGVDTRLGAPVRGVAWRGVV